jgi:uncharacterized membrane protein
MFYNVSLWAILAAALASMIIGFIWYSPILFARPWMIQMGYDPDDKSKLEELRKGAGRMYGIAFVLSLIGAFVLAKIISGLTIVTVLYGIKVGVAVWAGFVMPVQWTDQMFGRRPFRLFMINTGYQLVCYLVMGAILGRWS